MKQLQHTLFIRQPSIKHNASIVTFTVLLVDEYTENNNLSDISETLTSFILSSLFNVLNTIKYFLYVLLLVLPMPIKLCYTF